MGQTYKFVIERVENIEGKGEILSATIFSFFSPQYFPVFSFKFEHLQVCAVKGFSFRCPCEDYKTR